MRALYILLFFLVLSSCKYFSREKVIVKNDFRLKGNGTALCFDLLDDDQPQASLLVKNGVKPGDHTLKLPFTIKDVSNDREIWSTTASYYNYSLISYKSISDGDHTVGMVNFKPTINEIANDMRSDDDLPEGLYLKRSGLDRKFILKYSKKRETPILLDTIGLIALRLPKSAVGKEIIDGKTTIPSPLFDEESIKYFKSAEKQGFKVVKVGYVLPINTNQQMLFDAIIKLMCGFTIPGLELIYLNRSSAMTARKRKIIKICGFILQLIMLSVAVGLVYYGSISAQSILDSILLLTSAVMTLFIALSK